MSGPMLDNAEFLPVASCRLLGDARSITASAADLLIAENVAYGGWAPKPSTLKVMRWAVDEVLAAVARLCGAQREGDAAAAELWVDPSLLILCLRFRGAPLPDWTCANWDRGCTAARLAPGGRVGHGWLIVREAFDSVTHAWAGSEQQLFLEKRLR